MFRLRSGEGGEGVAHNRMKLPKPGLLRRIIRNGAAAAAILVLVTLVGLELWYRALLPYAMPIASKRTIPDLLKRTFWAYDFRGDGEPELPFMFPFFASIFTQGAQPRTSLAAGVARFYGKPERHLDYMLHQAALITWVSRNWSAEDAMNTYASHVWMGSEVYGVEGGAKLLFAKTVNELTIPETALLVATTRSPGRLSALCHPERATAARGDVLERMHAVHLISAAQLAAAAASPLGVRGSCQESGALPSPTKRVGNPSGEK
jgi:hypothetical protein